MPSSMINAESLLAVDIGAVTTQVTLFDIVDESYRFIASGQAQSTAIAPFRDVSEGLRRAIENLQVVTGRNFLNKDHSLIIPAQDGNGVDKFAATISAGPVIKVVVVGLLENVSLESVQRLARSTYTKIVDMISMNDQRRPEEQIDSILRLCPDLILIGGGSDNGASGSVQKLIEVVGLACHLLPAEKRPAILFSGNIRLVGEVRSTLKPLASTLYISSNLRPSANLEDLQSARYALAKLSTQIRRVHFGGVEGLNTLSGNTLTTTAFAEGRIIRILNEIYDTQKSILAVDLGASSTTIAAGIKGQLTLGVYPQFGLGENINDLLHHTGIEDIIRWLPIEISIEAVRDYIFNKALYPASLPATVEDLAIEQALARQCLHLALSSAREDFPRSIFEMTPDKMPNFDPILVRGSVVTQAPTMGQRLLILLDAIQPLGISTLILDQNNLLSALGAAVNHIPLLPVQVLESGAFLGLATVVSPKIYAHSGTPVLRARLVFQNGGETQVEAKQGTLEIMPLPNGQSGHLYLESLHNADVGFGAGRNGNIPVSGTMLGIVIDARGRPLHLPEDHTQRREKIKKWLSIVGG